MAEEALDGTVVEETEGSAGGYEPGQGGGQQAATEEPETLESLKARLELVNQKHDQRAAQANAHLREIRQYKQELAQLKAERQAEKEARFREEARRIQAARAEAYADAPDYVVDLATQIDNLKLQLAGNPEEEAQLDQQEEEVTYIAETLGDAQATFQRDPEAWDAFAHLIAMEKDALRDNALLSGSFLSEDEIDERVAHDSARVMAQWRQAGLQIDTATKYLAWNRGWRPPQAGEQQVQPQQPAQPRNGQQSASQARLNNQRQTQARRAPLAGPSSVGATGRPAADYSALSEEEWLEARQAGTITDAQAMAYELSLLQG